MKTTYLNWLAGAALALVAITIISWKRTDSTLPVSRFAHYQEDTTPHKKYSDKKEYTVGDLDKAIKELDRASFEMDRNMNFDVSKMDKEMEAAMDEVKKIDFDKIGREVAESMKKVDWPNIKAEIDRAMREVDVNMKTIDKKEIEKAIAEAKESVSAAKINAHIDMEGIKRSVDEGLKGARIGIENAKKELGLMKEFTETLETDGLINRKKGFKIEIKDNEMFINGTRQSKEVNDKYRKYFKNEDYTIKSNGDSISNL
jgi:hypothetical protein